VDVGLALPYTDRSVPGEEPLSWATLCSWAQRADELGFDSVWLADHLFSETHKYGAIEKDGAPARRDGTFDPIVAFAGLAAVTRNVRLGTLVLCSPFRPPTIAAKMLATLDLLSDGRVTIGIGGGWQRSEFIDGGIPFHPHAERLEQLVEAIEIIQRLLAGDHVTFAGRHYRAQDARFRPHPVQKPRPPIWVGGRSDGILDVAARCADGWNTCWVMTPDAYRGRLATLAASCERHDRDPADLTLSLGLTTLVGESETDVRARFDRLRALTPQGVITQPLEEWRRDRLVGTVDQVRDQVAEWESLGVTTVIAGLGALPFSVTDLDDLELVASAFA